MIAPTQIRKPENWQDFEKLCKKLWGEIWNCSDTIQRNGRMGQAQNGVDVYGMPKDENCYFGIQCKGKDDYTQSQLTMKEIDAEINNALKFQPHLKRFIFATTANKDSKIEEYIRVKNIEQQKLGLFEIYISSWEDIVDLLEERRNTYNWYMNNCQYKNSSDVDVFVNWEKECEIKPQYIRTKKIFIKKPEIDACKNPFYLFNQQLYADFANMDKVGRMTHFNDILNPKCKVDYRWCTIPINIKNIGDIVIEDYKLHLIFDPDSILNVDDKFHYVNNALMNQAALAQINASKEAKREVFESSEYLNVIIFKPIDKHLVQTDHKTFSVGVKPKDGVSEIEVHWVLKSRDYRKDGIFLLKVSPKYEDRRISVEVENEAELKETEIIIKPKIVEE